MQSNEDDFLDLELDEEESQEDDDSSNELSPNKGFNMSARRKIERLWEEKELIEKTGDIFSSWM